jgi:hypothetical protein
MTCLYTRSKVFLSSSEMILWEVIQCFTAFLDTLSLPSGVLTHHLRALSLFALICCVVAICLCDKIKYIVPKSENQLLGIRDNSSDRPILPKGRFGSEGLHCILSEKTKRDIYSLVEYVKCSLLVILILKKLPYADIL